MARIIEKTVYTFDELSDKAKERARDWWREGGLDYDWWDCVEEDFKTVCGLMGVDVERIAFSGFSSQGDGASFAGRYSYEKGAPKAIKEYAPNDAELLRIAKALQECQRQHFYKVCASIAQGGHYCHENTMSTNVYLVDNEYKSLGETEESLPELFRDLARWLYKQLEAEYESLNSDENVDETIRANEYEFTEDGERA